jgi:ankyrin repeat protein
MLLPKMLQKHLGHHMEQIALFVIPGSFEDDDNDDKIYDNDDVSEGMVDTDEEDTPINLAEFFGAAINGNVAVIQRALAENSIDINARGDPNYSQDKHSAKPDDQPTALMHACRNGHSGIVKLLLEQNNIAVNMDVSPGESALSYACENGHYDIVRRLLERDDIVTYGIPTGAKDCYDHLTMLAETDMKILRSC